MKKLMMKYLILSCREATFLMAKKEETKLTFKEKINLAIHTSMCKFCRKFEKQIFKITGECKHMHSENNLPGSARERIEQILEGYS